LGARCQSIRSCAGGIDIVDPSLAVREVLKEMSTRRTRAWRLWNDGKLMGIFTHSFAPRHFKAIPISGGLRSNTVLTVRHDPGRPFAVGCCVIEGTKIDDLIVVDEPNTLLEWWTRRTFARFKLI
jgi:hypothetical protein